MDTDSESPRIHNFSPLGCKSIMNTGKSCRKYRRKTMPFYDTYIKIQTNTKLDSSKIQVNIGHCILMYKKSAYTC